MAILKIKNANGEFENVPAIIGATGEQGIQGTVGANGKDGKDGVHIEGDINNLTAEVIASAMKNAGDIFLGKTTLHCENYYADGKEK
jgi:hypothetical protein